MCRNPHTLFLRLSSTCRRQDLRFWQSSSGQKTSNQNKQINMTRKCCRTQSPDRNTCSRGVDTIMLFPSKKRCFELMLFFMVSDCRRGILAALEVEAERAGGLRKGDEVFACALFFSADALESIAFTLKRAFPFHVMAVHLAGSFPPGSPKIVKISTDGTTPKYSPDTCLSFLCGGLGTSMWTRANMHWHRGHLQKGHDHAVKAAKSLHGWLENSVDSCRRGLLRLGFSFALVASCLNIQSWWRAR